MQIIYDKYSKEKLSTLPRVLFEGRIILVLNEREAEKAVNYLLSQPILGFDTETRPTFRKGVTHQVALLQVSTHDTCFLFRLCRTGLCAPIIRLLEDTTITKVGLSLKDDFFNLKHRKQFQPGTFIEIQNEVKTLGIEDASLQKIYANLFGQRISKGQQLTNWEADVLTEAQQRYAATDAWACIKIHEKVEELIRTNDYELQLQPQPQQQAQQ